MSKITAHKKLIAPHTIKFLSLSSKGSDAKKVTTKHP